MKKSSQKIYLKDYKKSDYQIDNVELDFVLDEERTIVSSVLAIKPVFDTKGSVPELFLNGDDLELISCSLDGTELSPKDYVINEDGWTLKNPPNRPFSLAFKVVVNPKANTELSGLYMSNGIFCTQCEPEGFRRITFYLDRPDVMARFKVTIHADKTKYPVLLSNGNLVEQGEDYAVWEDPFPKPSYLFAMIAANYDYIEDYFTTMSGRKVTLRIYADKQSKPLLSHAMASLKRAMKWDEEAFGREYDLDLFNIAAVHDFNAGAMENKGLNIFNERLILADTNIATDADYQTIEAVIGHEYFHNWTGDRITAENWFNLSLKEGLTVFREQEFSSDMGSHAVQRIKDVINLRTSQFSEDAGPLSHSIRPSSYISIDNFYTSTVYEKGAEVVRMMNCILGKDTFRKGMDLYFRTYDGQAVGIDEFTSCMEQAANIDFTAFRRWFSQSGTPKVSAKGEYDADKKQYALTLTQDYTSSFNGKDNLPFVIPIRLGLIDKDGNDMPLHNRETVKKSVSNDVIVLDEPSHTFIFEDVKEQPVLSLNRGFSAPVKLDIDYTPQELAHLMHYDSDLFIRWEAGQRYALNYILKLYDDMKNARSITIDTGFLNAFASYLDVDDKAFAALALRFPSLRVVAESLDKVNIPLLAKSLRQAKEIFARTFKDKLIAAYNKEDCTDMSMKKGAVAARAIRNQIVLYLALLGDDNTDDLVRNHYAFSPLMTNVQTALSAMVSNRIKGFDDALGDIYWHYKGNPIVINRWFLIQALAEKNPNLIQDMKKLIKDDEFSLFNPNNVYSLIGGFANNMEYFHAEDGSGYAFVADMIIKLDNINPAIASRMATHFSILPKLEEPWHSLMKAELQRIKNKENLSPVLYEIVSKTLG